eukprot:gene23149-30353_t
MEILNMLKEKKYYEHVGNYLEPTTVRRAYPSIQHFFKKVYPGLLTRHGRTISDAELDRLCGKVLLAIATVWEQYSRGYVASQVSTLALCFLHKREVLKVAKGDLPIQCVIMKTSAVNYTVPIPLDKDCDDHFELRLEVDDPDDTVNSPSLFFILPKSEYAFFEAPDWGGILECESWMIKLSGDCSKKHVQPSVFILPDCLTGGSLPVGPDGRNKRALLEDRDARLGICFLCRKRDGTENVKKCKGCKRVGYCSGECQAADWEEHKQCCKMTLQQTQQDSKGKEDLWLLK